jgi:IMP dehydrogenase/GMP reductase
MLTQGTGDTITVDDVSLVPLAESDVAPAGTEDARLVKIRFELKSFDTSGPNRG